MYTPDELQTVWESRGCARDARLAKGRERFHHDG
jgi:hypothetical protein